MFSSNAHYPLLLEEKEGVKDSPQIFFGRILQFKNLPQNEQDFIGSNFVVFSLETLEKKFTLSNETTQTITRVIRHFYFKKMSQHQALTFLDEKILSSHPYKEEILSFILKNLLSYTIPQDFLQQDMGNVSQESIVKKNTAPLSLKKAVEKYPRIMNQRVTDADIVFRGSDGAVVPSVKNWITTYHQEMGSGTHEPFERSQFLFHNKNAVMLSQRERNVLSKILQSFDEDSELPLNIETQTIDILQLESDNSSMATVPNVPENSSSYKEEFFAQEENTSAIPQHSNRAIPPAERSEASFSTREPIDDRRDTWHNDSEIFSPQKSSEHRPSFASKLSFTEHSSPEAPLKQSEIPAPAPTRGTTFFTPNQNIARENSSQVSIPQKPDTDTPKIPAFGKNINFSSFPQRGSSIIAPKKAEATSLGSVSGRNTLREWSRPSAPLSSAQPSLASRTSLLPPQQTNPSPNPSKSSLPVQNTQQVDYTDYYPIPKEPKTTKQPIAQNISFSSAHTFPVEKQQSVSTPKNVRDDFFFPSEKQAPPAPTNQTPPQQVPPAKQSPKRMIIG